MSVTAIGDRQIKAARALLDWSQDDLAQAARLSVATIRKLELGGISPRCSTTNVIREAFEREGIEFLDSEGVRRRQEDVIAYQGAAGCDAFLSDILGTVSRQGGEVLIVAASPFGVSRMLGAQACLFLEEFALQNGRIFIKVILPDAADVPMVLSGVEFRSLSTSYVDSMPFCIYGNKYAVLTGDRETNKTIVIQSNVAASAGRRQFYSMWDKAMSFPRFLKEEEKALVFSG